MNETQQRRAWEGLGGPIDVERPNLENIDPTLDSCCQREIEGQRYAAKKRQALRRHDVVAAKERARRNLVTNPLTGFVGCRCCYDPDSDGSGDYRALVSFRERLDQAEARSAEDNDDDLENNNEKKNPIRNDSDDDGDDDDEFDYLLDEEISGIETGNGSTNDTIKAWEEQRRTELEETMWKRERAVQHGYGVHRAMHPARVLRAAGLAPGTRDPPPSAVLHLFDPDSDASASLDACLERIAAERAPGTKFVRSGGRSTLLMDAELASRVLPSLKPDRDIPALIVVRDGVAVNVCPNLSGLVDRDTGYVVDDAVYGWLDRSGALLSSIPSVDEVCRIRPEEEALMEYMSSASNPSNDAPTEERHYNCGVPDCQKTYPHEHVGISNEQQRGLVVSEEDVLGGGGYPKEKRPERKIPENAI